MEILVKPCYGGCLVEASLHKCLLDAIQSISGAGNPLIFNVETILKQNNAFPPPAKCGNTRSNVWSLGAKNIPWEPIYGTKTHAELHLQNSKRSHMVQVIPQRMICSSLVTGPLCLGICTAPGQFSEGLRKVVPKSPSPFS